MKQLMIMMLVGLFAAALIIGCGQEGEEGAADKVPAEVKTAEMADTTRMDSAMHDTGMMMEDSAMYDTAMGEY